MLDLGRLKALHAVHTHGSIGPRPALGYTPSAVSQQISKLERETGAVLLERQGRGVALTDAARLLVATAERVMAIVEPAEVALEEQRGQAAGRLTVAAFPTAACGLLPPVLAELAASIPALELRLVEVDAHLSVDLVARGVVDWRWRTTGTSRRCRLPGGGGAGGHRGRPVRCAGAGGPPAGPGRTRWCGRMWRGSGGSASRRARCATTGWSGRCGRRARSPTWRTRSAEYRHAGGAGGGGSGHRAGAAAGARGRSRRGCGCCRWSPRRCGGCTRCGGRGASRRPSIEVAVEATGGRPLTAGRRPAAEGVTPARARPPDH